MSIHYSGAISRSKGIVSAIGKQLKKVNLKGLNRVTFTFDPFGENVKSTRELLFLLSSPKVQQSNPKCMFKTDIVCDRQQPSVRFALIESARNQANVKEIRFNTANLNTLELLQLFNEHLSILAPVETLTKTVATKSEKQKTSGKAQRKK